MSDGYSWDEMQVALRGPGTEIRRADDGGLSQSLIRLEAGVRTHELFIGLPDDRCQCAHWGYIISGTNRLRLPHMANGADTAPETAGPVERHRAAQRFRVAKEYTKLEYENDGDPNPPRRSSGVPHLHPVSPN